jgi:hypothetical protein
MYAETNGSSRGGGQQIHPKEQSPPKDWGCHFSPSPCQRLSQGTFLELARTDWEELYEPFFDAILERSGKAGFRIRAIWAPDIANQGASGVRNENKLGDMGNLLVWGLELMW